MKLIPAILFTLIFPTLVYAEESKKNSTTQGNAEQVLLKHVISSFQPPFRQDIHHGGTLLNLNFDNGNREIEDLDRLMINGGDIPLKVRFLYAERLLLNEKNRLFLVTINMSPSSSGIAEQSLHKAQKKVDIELKKVREFLNKIKSSKTNKSQ
jgi:hypothetical protein